MLLFDNQLARCSHCRVRQPASLLARCRHYNANIFFSVSQLAGFSMGSIKIQCQFQQRVHYSQLTGVAVLPLSIVEIEDMKVNSSMLSPQHIRFEILARRSGDCLTAMPPKVGGAKAANRPHAPKGKAAAQPGNVVVSPDACDVDAVNMEHYRDVDSALTTILGHHLFKDVMTEEPLSIKEGVASHLAGHKAGIGNAFF